MRLALFSIFLIATSLGCAQAQSSPSLTVATDHGYYLPDLENDVYVESRIDLPALGGASQPITQRNIAFVLDRSGSMLGPRIEALRKAVSLAISSLSDRDTVSVVVFGSEVETLIEAKRRDQLAGFDALLAQIEPSGGSDLYDALNQGAAQLRRYATPSTHNQLILVTDGPATKGPRETDDFLRLCESFARENINLCTVGIGEDFNEDQLASMARSGNGQFRFAAKPESLVDIIPSEVARPSSIVAMDAVLTVECPSGATKIESYGWTPATLTEKKATYSFPHLYAGQSVRILTAISARARMFSYRLGTIRLTWKDAVDGQAHEIVKPLEIRLEADREAIRTSKDPEVCRNMGDAIVRQGLQDAIQQIDKGDLKRAQRKLRDAREELYSLNDQLDDAQISAKITELEKYLAEVKARGLNQLDRKVLRSGLFNRFGIPTTEDGSSH